MAASSLFLGLIFWFSFSFAERPETPITVTLPLIKDRATLQYVVHLHHAGLVVDLGGRFPWLDCSSIHASSSQRLITSGSLSCSMTNPNSCLHGRSTFSNSKFHPCFLKTVNSITGLASCAPLAEDILTVNPLDSSDSVIVVDHFMFSCAPPLLLKGLAGGTKGILGLGVDKLSLPSQFAVALGVHRRFAICLSSTQGYLVFSGDHIPSSSIIGSQLWNSLTYTPLISSTDGYYINVKSIKINGKTVSLNTSLLSLDKNGTGGTKLSTVAPYTTMETSIYNAFVKEFVETSNSMKMKRVAAVAPFGVCFESEGRHGQVPTVDLVLQSEMVKWRIGGRNSMVEVGDGVMCLGFLDGGNWLINSKTKEPSIVIGGHQLEDNLLDFDMGNSMLGFTSSLLSKGTSCSYSPLLPL
ncbi:probable aspartic proteinase GIP2 [Impatiens glandulifera]|uniref:probable aspartic proteinase GIP2 n=1 Tax=Impatiens glandulifera TaxID=253017 RepID=UPI001FB0DE0A|nr:probable aspartic proteinase GIP2 [Impatiens glandulifera]